MKYIYIIIIIVIILLGFYYFTRIDGSKTLENVGNINTYSNKSIGLEFKYRTGPSGYVVQELEPQKNDQGLIKTIVLIQTSDLNNPPPVGGEGPATITMYVLKNIKKEFPRNWADKNIQYSNINLKIGEVSEAVVGGVNAVRYMATGLYNSENVVVAHGENIYVISGMHMDENSNLRKDYTPLVESVRFIQQPGQE